MDVNLKTSQKQISRRWIKAANKHFLAIPKSLNFDPDHSNPVCTYIVNISKIRGLSLPTQVFFY